ncbi:competence protein ComEA [Ectothiorhodospira haloalkaliphila]|uniref:Competence protein ComEA n=1 Tax=Ectothiorhodospira haloalkaliphila TaxID=421628 RepID=W8KUD9_9GAMM|nr:MULTISPECIES: ComEA family DNA-binding protein [Ectothiorhodospira]AHK79166.1 competence protein ComEA [Ectothiorhodospira haloalkaliphila]MCG5495072.1 ComEA family DNA-binding protein [Ectothiorhodospira variabilis]MCG5498613.1 ComEA family DNA-binding protein [Ectothiorhodospira variabilis]MCG5504659.1 ComEA family DNA-binding protein [Ectothiorhodospira variabilis]MCG5507788.1 ComEA family DNA-binding protein [Ectothiorhodospira variabilis]
MKHLSVLILFFLCTFTAAGLQAGGPVDINRADAQALSQALQGVGPAKAQAIVEYREANGPFRSVHELTQVGGIGVRTVEINLDVITLDQDVAANQ